jgi:hypothetical protein
MNGTDTCTAAAGAAGMIQGWILHHDDAPNAALPLQAHSHTMQQ